MPVAAGTYDPHSIQRRAHLSAAENGSRIPAELKSFEFPSRRETRTSGKPIPGNRISLKRLLVVLFSLVLSGPTPASFAQDIEATRTLLLKGNYSECIQIAGKAIDGRVFGEDWYLLKAEAEMQTGHYKEAYETISAGLTRYAWSVRLRQAGVDPARMSANVMQGTVWQAEMADVVSRAAWRYSGDADSLVSLGRVAAATGGDSRQVLEAFYDRALKVTPAHPGALLASGEMALSKKDYSLAAETFQDGVKFHPNDADMHFGLARAIESSQPPLAAHHLSEAFV